MTLFVLVETMVFQGSYPLNNDDFLQLIDFNNTTMLNESETGVRNARVEVFHALACVMCAASNFPFLQVFTRLGARSILQITTSPFSSSSAVLAWSDKNHLYLRGMARSKHGTPPVDPSYTEDTNTTEIEALKSQRYTCFYLNGIVGNSESLVQSHS